MNEYAQAEYLISPPHQLNKWRWCWDVYLPQIQGQPTIANGYGRDRQHAIECAEKALNSVRRYGKDSCLF